MRHTLFEWSNPGLAVHGRKNLVDDNLVGENLVGKNLARQNLIGEKLLEQKKFIR